MMNLVDVIPRAAISLMLTVGGLLSEYVGLEHPWWQMAGIVLLGQLMRARLAPLRPAVAELATAGKKKGPGLAGASHPMDRSLAGP